MISCSLVSLVRKSSMSWMMSTHMSQTRSRGCSGGGPGRGGEAEHGEGELVQYMEGAGWAGGGRYFFVKKKI